MTGVLNAASWTIAGAGLILAVAVALRTARLLVALPVLLDMLLAAGLLRLSADAPWPAIATTATIVVLRKTVAAGITESGSAWGVRRAASPPSPPPPR